MTKRSPFCYFKTSREIIRLAVMMYVRFALSLRNVEELLHERGTDISHGTVRFLVKSVRPDFRGRDPQKAYPAVARPFQLAMASGRGVGENNRRATLPLAGGRP